MANKVLLKKSSTAAKVPLVTDLDYGELAINYTDGNLFYRTNTDEIKVIASKNLNKQFIRVIGNETSIINDFESVCNMQNLLMPAFLERINKSKDL